MYIYIIDMYGVRDSVTMAFLGKFSYMTHHFILLGLNPSALWRLRGLVV